MSIQALAWVLENSQAVGRSRLVLISIANHMSGSGVSWPGYETIAREANCDRRTAIRAVAALVEAGELQVAKHGGGKGGRGHTNQYSMPTINGDITPPFERRKRVTSGPERVTSRPVNGDIAVSPDTKEPKRTVASPARFAAQRGTAGDRNRHLLCARQRSDPGRHRRQAKPICFRCSNTGWQDDPAGTDTVVRCNHMFSIAGTGTASVRYGSISPVRVTDCELDSPARSALTADLTSESHPLACQPVFS